MHYIANLVAIATSKTHRLHLTFTSLGRHMHSRRILYLRYRVLHIAVIGLVGQNTGVYNTEHVWIYLMFAGL